MTTFTRTRNYVSRMYSGPRLTTMILLLGVVGVMVYNASDPQNWKWLEELAPESTASTAQPMPQLEKKSAASIRYDATSKDYDPAKVKVDDPTNANFHWDQDPDEKDELAKEFQVVLDGSTEILPEEMFGYSRLLRWINTRAYQDLLAASHSAWTFNELHQTPKQHRGKLLKVPLNVVRILPCDYTDPTTKEARKIYEVWGWSARSSSWLYVAIVPELPEGMPSGVSLRERVTLVGYFYKLQGYLEAKAAPRSKPLLAPLLIGRLAWEPNTREVTPPSPPRLNWNKEWTWWTLGGLAIVYLGIRWRLSGSKNRPNTEAQKLDDKDAALIGDWLESPTASETEDPEFEGDPAAQRLQQNTSSFTNSSQGSNT